MPETIRRSMAHLARLVVENQDAILERWLAMQLAADTLRPDLMDEEGLREESREFLAAFSQGLAKSDTTDLGAKGWNAVVGFLAELSEARDEAGFTPLETATFVLSLKRPLIGLVLDEEGEEEAQEPQLDLWTLSTLLDSMALYTTETYRKKREATIARQQQEMEELATPVVKVWDGILALPLVGTMDTRRSQMVTESLLETIAATGSEVAILDLTGVPAIDTRMAQHLMRTVAAARLMGANCILSGIRPQIAQTIVHLKINLGDIKTESNLAAALKLAFEETGKKVVGES